MFRGKSLKRLEEPTGSITPVKDQPFGKAEET
jgi:hypothetical protein